MPDQRGMWKASHQTLIMAVSDLEQCLLSFVSGLGLGLGEWGGPVSYKV